jgi:tRNA A-37 threonylcarbamoyl transferase component Bud32
MIMEKINGHSFGRCFESIEETIHNCFYAMLKKKWHPDNNYLDLLIKNSPFTIDSYKKAYLEFAHQLGRLHANGWFGGDLNHNNRILAHDGRVFLIDFSSAKKIPANRRSSIAKKLIKDEAFEVYNTISSSSICPYYEGELSFKKQRTAWIQEILFAYRKAGGLPEIEQYVLKRLKEE